MVQQYRYPGAKPFQTVDSHVFYGRAAVSKDLYQLIRLEPLVVLHAKSGLGKSSVINAGVIPLVMEGKEFKHYNVRFFADTEEKTETPLDITRSEVKSQSDLLDKIRPQGDDSLWYHLKSLQLAVADDKGILLFFDQFEELFTYKDATVEAFSQQLSEALYTTLPQRFRDERKKGFEKDKNFLTDHELALLDQPLNLRLLMSIRSDRMSLMKRNKAYFPTILSADFELHALNREQAEDAILSPAYQKGNFITPIFDYEDDGIEYLLDFLSEGGTEPIESFQLQILCEYVEQYLVEKQGKTLISKEDIANPEQILENYYLDKINLITNPEHRLAARRLIEEGFIFEEEERRLTLYEGQIFKAYGITPELLDELLDTHLIRSEPSLRGGYTYELSHDTLVGPVLKAKAKRRAAEQLVEEKEALQKREAELAILRQKEEEARLQAEKEKGLREKAESNEKQARKRTRLAIWVSGFALILACLSFFLYTAAADAIKSSQQSLDMAWEAQREVKKQKNKLEEKAQRLLIAQEETTEALEKAQIQTILAETNEQKAIVAQAQTKDALARAEEDKLKAEFQTVIAKESERNANISRMLTERSRIAEGIATKNALKAQAKAEDAATAAQNASLALRIAKNNPTLAIRIADYNSKLHPDNPAGIAVFREVISDPQNMYFKNSFEGHTSSISSVSFSPNGDNILTGSKDNSAKLWDLQGNELVSFEGHTDDVTSVSFSPSGDSILTGSKDNSAKLWDLQGNVLVSFVNHADDVTSVSFSPKGDSILTGSKDNTAKLWDLKGNVLVIFEGSHTDDVSAVSFSPNGNSILTGSSDNTAKLWDLQGKAKVGFDNHESSVLAVSYSYDGEYILTGSRDKTAKLWDIKGNELVIFKSSHTDEVTAVSFSPDGNSILTGSKDKTAKLRDVSGKKLITFLGHSGSISSVSFSQDGKTILTGSNDGTAKLWDIQGIELGGVEGHATYNPSISFSPDDKNILTGGEDNTAKLWQMSQPFLDQKVHKFSLQELYDAGIILEKEDLKKVKQKED